MKTIVILGAGFGGVYAYKCLRAHTDPRRVHIILINRTDHFLFSPLLHEAATGGLSTQSTIQCVSDFIDRGCASFLKAEIRSIDQQRNTVRTSTGDVRYDQLVIATGAATNFLQVPGAAEYTFPLKSYDDARRLRHRLNALFTAEALLEGMFVIVGGGPTGVEVAAEVADLLGEKLRVVVVHAGKHLLPAFHPALGRKALQTLQKKGVEVRLHTRVQRVEREHIHLFDSTVLPVCGVVWAAGVAPLVPDAEPALPRSEGRIAVDAFLRVEGSENIWAIGDVAAAPGEKLGSLSPMRAQAAVQQAHAVADNLRAVLRGKRPQPYRYHSKGDLVSLGLWNAVGDIAGIRWSGPFAWWLWRTVYLFTFASWKKRFRIAVEWTMQLFRPRDVTST